MKRIERRPFQKHLFGRPEEGSERSAGMLRQVSAYERNRRIKDLTSLDLLALNDDQIRQRIGKAFHGYIQLVANQVSNFAFRARINSASVPFHNAADLWYPPARLVTSLGRFNREGNPIFYGTSSAAAAVCEIMSGASAVATILIVGSKTAYHRTEAVRLGFQMLHARIRNQVGNQGLPGDERFEAMLQHFNVARQWAQVDEAIGQIVTTDISGHPDSRFYRLTCGLGEWFTKATPSRSLVYPSVASARNEVNFCMQPSIADDTFFPAEAWMIEAHASDVRMADGRIGKKLDISLIRRSKSISSDGSIDWIEENEPNTIQGLLEPQSRIEEYRRRWHAGDPGEWAKVIAGR